MPEWERPLEGVLVLDFSQFLAGPVAALRLADLGARVVKIERPVGGEIGRTLAFAGRVVDGDTVSFQAMNRGKESVTADLKDAADLAAVRDLVARADVLIHNFRPGVMERLGLGPDVALALNPRLVYAAATGYGETGPWTRRPGQDLLAQSISGLTRLDPHGPRPVPVGLALADHLMSCHLAQGVTALLVRAARTGRGGVAQTSLLEAVLDLQSTVLTSHFATAPGTAASTDTADSEDLLPGAVHATADGHLAVAPTPPGRWATLLHDRRSGSTAPTTGPPAPRTAIMDSPAALEERVARLLTTAPTAHWLDALARAGIEAAPVLTLEEMLEHEAFTAVDMVQETVRPPRRPGDDPVRLRTTRSPIRVDGRQLRGERGAPRLGEQGDVHALLPQVAPSPGVLAAGQ